MKLEEVWKDDEAITLDEFKSRSADAKFVDLKEGGYVSKGRYEAELEAKNEQVRQLNESLSQRESDLKEVQKKLQSAGQDTEKLAKVSEDLTALQGKYTDDMKSYEEKLSKQARDFAIKEYAATKKFSSAAAKRDYIKSMQSSEDVKLSKKGSLTGVNEFDDGYRTENEDAFLKEVEPETESKSKLPMFTSSTSKTSEGSAPKESFGFSFIPQTGKE